MAVLSFRGTQFELLHDGDWVPAPPPPEPLEHIHVIPYSSEVIVDDGGEGAAIWTVSIRVLTANVTALLGQRRLTGALVTNDGTFSNSKLSKLSDRRGTPTAGGSGRTYVAFTATFIVA